MLLRRLAAQRGRVLQEDSEEEDDEDYDDQSEYPTQCDNQSQFSNQDNHDSHISKPVNGEYSPAEGDIDNEDGDYPRQGELYEIYRRNNTDIFDEEYSEEDSSEEVENN